MKFEAMILFFDGEIKEKLIFPEWGLKRKHKLDLKDLLDVDGRLIRGGICSLKSPTLHVKLKERWEGLHVIIDT